MNKKNIGIFLVWTIVGYMCFYISTKLFTLISMSYLQGFIRAVKEFTVSPFFNNLFLYSFTYAVDVFILFLFALLLGRLFGLRMIWLLGFIIGAIAIKVGLSIQNLFLIYSQYAKIPLWELKPFIITLLINVFLMSGTGWLGCFWGSKIRGHGNALN